MDILFIDQLTVMAVIGIHEWEQHYQQKLVLNIEIGYNNRSAAHKNNIVDCLSYTKITEFILTFISSKHFTLIESFAEELSNLLIARFKLTWLRLKVGKPSAIPQAFNVGVIIERRKIDELPVKQ